MPESAPKIVKTMHHVIEQDNGSWTAWNGNTPVWNLSIYPTDACLGIFISNVYQAVKNGEFADVIADGAEVLVVLQRIAVGGFRAVILVDSGDVTHDA